MRLTPPFCNTVAQHSCNDIAWRAICQYRFRKNGKREQLEFAGPRRVPVICTSAFPVSIDGNGNHAAAGGALVHISIEENGAEGFPRWRQSQLGQLLQRRIHREAPNKSSAAEQRIFCSIHSALNQNLSL